MQLGGFGVVVVHVLDQPAVLGGGDAKDFRQGAAGQHNLLRHLRKKVQPGGLLGKKAQLHVVPSPGKV
ncbi:hypothetical protein ARTHROSP310_25450 [Arthrobacter sp. AD-310]